MKIAIGIATYQRIDGTTPKYLARALNSILSQAHQDFKVILIGDNYEDQAEFNSLASIIPREKIFAENLPIAVERSKYKMGSRELWCSGGSNAYNRAIDACLFLGYDYMCHLDHDDYWSANHLHYVNCVIERFSPALVYTCSEHINNRILPNVTTDNCVYESMPAAYNAVHSSICINHRLVSLKYRDVFAETGRALEADADMLIRLNQYLPERNLKSYLIAATTCFHLQENY